MQLLNSNPSSVLKAGSLAELKTLVIPLALLLGAGSSLEGQDATSCEEREAQADSAARQCSGDCRFEWSRALRIEFSCQTKEESEAARVLALAIDSDHDAYWVDAYTALLAPSPEDAAWVRSYWRERMDEEGHLPPDLRASLVAEVKRIARIQYKQLRRQIEHYTNIARVYGLDPGLIIYDPFTPVEAWLEAGR